MSDVIIDAIGAKMISRWRQEAIDAGHPRKRAHQDAVRRWHNSQPHFEEQIANSIIRLLEKDTFLQRLSGDVTD